jgi:succinate dehydrogenase / fumarate reductase cytochrome b subunit
MEAQHAVSPLRKRGNSNKHFVLSRLHSLAGIVPLGLFMMEHFFSNATAMLGAEVYNNQVAKLQSIPFLPLIEILFIGLPLAYHAIYGLYLAFISKNNSTAYRYQRNWLFLFQRITGVVTLIFVVYHVWAFRLKKAFFGTEINFQTVSDDLMIPAIFAFYVIGVISTSFHFCNGLSTACITWGITRGRKSQKAASQLAFIAFILMSAVGVGSLIAFV